MKIDERLDRLRELMKEHDFAAYIIPTDDFHSSEYVGSYFKAREYMSGFSGSAGTLVVLQDKAADIFSRRRSSLRTAPSS